MSEEQERPLPGPSAGLPDTTRRIDPGEGTSELARVLEQYMAELEAGNVPDRAALLAAHPHLSPQLEQALAGLEFIHQSAGREAASPVQLGDFHIVREVGRGGMGVVYEAEQISLKRRVALKVLQFGAIVDEVALQRFQREAETVARLHHTNIVPVFAVGSEGGVRYYAMQFIDGRDLADLAQEAREARHALPARDIANWGLQAAEALAHAHLRGVIHRDIKPSNLILDRDDRIWLTDFGLARRVDDVALSVVGALLGTPRYMSPEQARASKDPIDHRTDIYSLGVTLYELATGQPIFEAATAHEVIGQILHSEPRAPRQLAPELPRDLETIILKCLAKEPAQRYGTAQALADDLRAFLEGRAISVRPPSVPEQVMRWARKHRRTTGVVALSSGTALVLAAAGYFFWQERQQSRLGQLRLTTDTPNVLAEVVDSGGDAVTPIFPVPTAEAVSVPAGSYKLRLSAAGVLSETWPVEIARQQLLHHHVQLNPRWLWPPKEVNTAEYPETEIVSFGAHADLLVLTHSALDQSGRRYEYHRLRRLDGATSQPVWELEFNDRTVPGGGNASDWKMHFSATGLAHSFRKTEIAERLRDLDGDGTNDLVLISRSLPSLLAVSGGTGRVLWWAQVRPELAGGATNEAKLERTGRGAVVGLPAVGDLDGDGVDDFVACFRSDGDTYVTARRAYVQTGRQNWLAAVSGRTGALLWRQAVAAKWDDYVNSSSAFDKIDPLCRPAIGRVGGRGVVVLVDGKRLLGFNARDGEPAWPPITLPFEPVCAPDLSDLDGDGGSEALLSQRQTDPDPLTRGENSSQQRRESSLTVVAVSLPDGKVRWERKVQSAPQWQSQAFEDPRRRFHWIVDLNGDGRQEVLLATGQRRELLTPSRHDVQLIDGATGSNYWRRLLHVERHSSSPLGAEPFPGPDLDGDGHREIFAAWNCYYEERNKHGLMVGAISGATGRMLWRWFQPGVGEAQVLQWWHAGADGWPLLLVPVHQAAGGQAMTFVLASGSGALEYTLPGVREVRPADFDGDGILDLFYSVSPQGAPRQLVVKGSVPEPWRRLGEWRAAGDLDGDGTADFAGLDDGGLAARSGRQDHLLWQVKKILRDSPMESPIPVGDLDGDGVRDVLATEHAWRERAPQNFSMQRMLTAFSGKDGHRLWTSGELGLERGSASGGGSLWSYRYPQVEWGDLNGDGAMELFALLYDGLSGQAQFSAVSGRDGRRLWQVSMTLGGFGLTPLPAGRPFGDFNGDGVLDVALWAPGVRSTGDRESVVLNVFDGRTGAPLWDKPGIPQRNAAKLLWPEPTVGDLDGDGIPEIAVTRRGEYRSRGAGYTCELLVVDGRSGAVRWKWAWETGHPDVWPPIFVKSGPAGKTVLGLAVSQPEARGLRGLRGIVMLDADGLEVARRPFVTSLSDPYDWGRYVWRAADVDGDGSEELCFIDESKLWVARADNLKTVWQWPLPDAATRLLHVSPRGPRGGALLTVWTGGDVYGVDGATGNLLWRCPVSLAPRQGGSDSPEVQPMESAAFQGPIRQAQGGPIRQAQGGLPRVQPYLTGSYGREFPSIVRQAWPAGQKGIFLPPQPQPQTYAVLPELALPKRSLPWGPPYQLPPLAIFTGLLTLAVFGIPAAFMRWAMRRRSWGLSFLPVCYAGLAVLVLKQGAVALVALGFSCWLVIFAWRAKQKRFVPLALFYAALSLAFLLLGNVTGALEPGPPRWGGWWARDEWIRRPLVLATIGAPGLLFWIFCGAAMRARRWITLGWLSGASVVAAMLAAGWSLFADAAQLAPDQSYSLRGWYLIWCVGTYIAGLAALLIFGARRFIAWFRRRRAASAAAPPALA